MRNYTMAMAAMGLLIGVLTLSAALAGARIPAAERRRGETEAVVPVALIELAAETEFPAQTQTGAREAAAPPAPESGARDGAEAPGPFLVALRLGENVPERLFLADSEGCPMEAIDADRDGDATLGPIAPGRYAVVVGLDRLGSFELLDNAALGGADGQLWTDGELLYLSNFVPGAAELELRLGAPGFYSLSLRGAGGDYSADLFISERERPDEGSVWRRTLRFDGLPAGSYRVLRDDRLLTTLVVRAGETVRTELRLGG